MAAMVDRRKIEWDDGPIPPYSYSYDYLGKSVVHNQPPVQTTETLPEPTVDGVDQGRIVRYTKPIFDTLSRMWTALEQGYRRWQFRQLDKAPTLPSKSMEVDLSLSEIGSPSEPFVVIDSDREQFLGQNFLRLKEKVLNHFQRAKALGGHGADEIRQILENIAAVISHIEAQLEQEHNFVRKGKLEEAIEAMQLIKTEIVKYVAKGKIRLKQ